MKKLTKSLCCAVLGAFSSCSNAALPEDIGATSAALHTGAQYLHPAGDHAMDPAPAFASPDTACRSCPCVDSDGCPASRFTIDITGPTCNNTGSIWKCVKEDVNARHDNYVGVGDAVHPGAHGAVYFRTEHLATGLCLTSGLTINSITIHAEADGTSGGPGYAWIYGGIFTSKPGGAVGSSASSWQAPHQIFSVSSVNWVMNTNPTTGRAWTTDEFCFGNAPVIGFWADYPNALDLEEGGLQINYSTL